MFLANSKIEYPFLGNLVYVKVGADFIMEPLKCLSLFLFSLKEGEEN